MDRLSTLLAQFGMHATTFYAGTFSGELAYDAQERSGKLPASVAAAHMFFNDAAAFKAAMGAEGKVLGADRTNYTDIIPVVVISQVIQ